MLRRVESSLAQPASTAPRPLDPEELTTPATVARRLLERLEVELVIDTEELASIPARGPVLFVANHPLGELDELIAIAVAGSVRPDLRLLGSAGLHAVPELRALVLGALSTGAEPPRAHSPALRQAVRWLEVGQAVLAFPAGAAANYDLRARCVTDAPWSPATARLVRLTHAHVVPIHIAARPGAFFPILGALSTRLRKRLVHRELRWHRGARIPVHVGAPIPAARLARFDDNEAIAVHLRLQTLLAGPRNGARVTAPRIRELSPLAPEMPRDALTAEVAALPPASRLAVHGHLVAHLAEASRIPHVLAEIGRLRESTARAAGGGHGRSRDLDAFDRHYEHLFVWDSAAQRVVGACRLGRIDAIRSQLGAEALHCVAQFRFREPALRLLGAAIEIDRPFATGSMAADSAPLALLWRALGEFVAREPRYCRWIATVHAGAGWSPVSQELLGGFLRRRRADALLAPLVKPRRPLAHSTAPGALGIELGLLSNVDPLERLIDAIEQHGDTLPPELRHYLRLGAGALALGTSATDGIEILLLADLRHAKPRALARCLGEVGLQGFRAFHGLRETSWLSPNRTPRGAVD